MGKIGILLDLIADVVDDDSQRWTIKRDAIRQALVANERLETAFEEFISWFETDGDDDDDEDEGKEDA